MHSSRKIISFYKVQQTWYYQGKALFSLAIKNIVSESFVYIDKQVSNVDR